VSQKVGGDKWEAWPEPKLKGGSQPTEERVGNEERERKAKACDHLNTSW